MICKVKKTLEEHSMLSSGDCVVVGFSGGADSVCLLDILLRLKESLHLTLKAVHVNHNLRGEEALSDQKFVESFCRLRGVELQVVSVDVEKRAKKEHIGLEECGRKVRYEAFERAGGDKIAVAHSLSDRIETTLFNLARGSSLSGVCGISPVNGKIIRPLIGCTRNEIESYCLERGLSFVIDSSNLSDDYSRNFIRHRIVPEFKKLNDGFEGAFERFFENCERDESFLEAQTRSAIKKSERENGFDRNELLSLDESVLFRVIHTVLEERMKKQVETKHIRLVADIIKNCGKIQLSQDLYICANSDIIYFQFSDSAGEPWFCEPKDGVFVSPYKIYELKRLDIDRAQADTENIVDFSNIKTPLVLRSRRPGDRFAPAGRGCTKTLKKLFNEAKIPPRKRNEIALLESGGEIVWIEGFGVSELFKPNDSCKETFIINIKER